MKTHPTLLLFLSTLIALSCNSVKQEKAVQIFAKGYDRHVELQWPKQENAVSYQVLVSSDGENYSERATVEDTIYMDFVNDLGANLSLQYQIVAIDSAEAQIPVGVAEV